ncbi:glycosyltransferase [Clostridium sp.]|uniref:glycosyltransferase n=1 Tax=Clostridium sp. TaxID=1506 RepID=UPI0039F4CC9E
MKLSICMMVKDEEKNIRRCLENLKPIINTGLAELIIVDTGSQDNTVLIAKEYTDKVYFHKWNKNFSEMRNKSISYAKGEWIFIIDADERLDDIDKMITLLNSNELNNFNTVLVQVKNLYDYKDEDRYNLILSPRLFRNDGEFRYEGAVHNQPIFKGPNLSVDIALTHFGYISTDKELMEKKYKRTVELLKYELKKDPENLYYLYQLGVSYDMHGDHNESLKEFRKAYNILKNKNLIKENIYTYILGSHARIAYTNGELSESIKVAKEVISVQSEYVDMYYIIAVSEKQLGNKKESFKYFNKYIDLVKKYDKLEIAKDLTIIMYHMDKNSISNGYFEIFQHYLNEEKYLEAYKNYKHITLVNQKIYSGINILIKLKKHDELYDLYISLTNKKEKDTFLVTLESKLDEVEYNNRVEIYKRFSSDTDIYGLLNQLRLTDDVNIKSNLIKLILQNLDLDKEPLFYAEVLNNFKEDIPFLINILTKVETLNVRKILQYLIEKDKRFINAFEEYVSQLEEEVVSAADINVLRVNIVLMSVLLLINARDNSTINDKYKNIFDKYIKCGIKFISELYRIEKASLIYKSVSNMEDRFFLIMYLVNQDLLNDNKKAIVNHLLEALNTYEAMAKYIDIYKNDLLFSEKDIIEEKQKSQFDEYKTQVKSNINTLISSGNLEEAKELIKQYEDIVHNDIEIYSIKAVIAIMEEKYSEAENILKSGLKKEPFNQDLLYNLSYLMDITKKNKKSLECFSTAKLFNPNSNVKVNDIICDLKAIDNNNLKVIHGTMEIANQMCTLTSGLKRIRIDAKTLNYYPNYLGYKSDYTLDISSFNNVNEANIETKKLAAKVISENDVFHFHFGTSLTLDYSDLSLLNELGKKVLMHHWGSDVRMYSKAIQFNPYVKVKNMDEDSIKRKLEFISKHISHCVVSDYELYNYVKDFYCNVHLIRQAIDLEKYKIKNYKNNKLFIVHAPSSPEIKGTKYILSAIEELKQKYDFDFKLIQGMPHEEAKKIYQKADIIIDQILCGSHGLFAIESMAMGKPVVCFISDHLKDTYPKELPIISANPDNIKEKLEYVINNRDMLSEIGNKGRKYVEKYHDMNVISKQLLDLYKSI